MGPSATHSSGSFSLVSFFCSSSASGTAQEGHTRQRAVTQPGPLQALSLGVQRKSYLGCPAPWQLAVPSWCPAGKRGAQMAALQAKACEVRWRKPILRTACGTMQQTLPKPSCLPAAPNTSKDAINAVVCVNWADHELWCGRKKKRWQVWCKPSGEISGPKSIIMSCRSVYPGFPWIS